MHVDHFVEVNMAGFYYLAQMFGGIEACIKPAPAQGGFPAGANLSDYDVQTGTDNSGFSAYRDGYDAKKGGAQYLHLNAAQALAFTRSRDTLPGIDIGRTSRQQAVLDYVIWKVGHQGILTSFGQLSSLLDTIEKYRYIVTPRGWDLLTFASEMHALTGKNLTLSTLPGTTQNDYDLNGVPQDVLLINVPYIQQLVQTAFSRPPGAKPKGSPSKSPAKAVPAASTVTVDVYNGGSAIGLAGQVSQELVSAGYKAGAVSNPSAQAQTVASATQVFYGAGASANAAKLAGYFGATAGAASSVPAGHVEVLLGTSSAAVPPALSSPAPGSSTASPGPGSPTPSASSPAPRQAAPAVTVTANAPFGIPCVY